MVVLQPYSVLRAYKLMYLDRFLHKLWTQISPQILDYGEYTLEEAFFNQLEEERREKKREKRKKKKRKN